MAATLSATLSGPMPSASEIDDVDLATAVRGVTTEQTKPQRRLDGREIRAEILVDPFAPSRIDEQNVDVVRGHAPPRFARFRTSRLLQTLP